MEENARKILIERDKERRSFLYRDPLERTHEVQDEWSAMVSSLKPLVFEKAQVSDSENIVPLGLGNLLSRMSKKVAKEEIEEIEDHTLKNVPEIRSGPFINSLASVGIESEEYFFERVFSPHNRDFFLLPTLGEFTFRGETVEDYDFPVIGAEKFSRNAFSAVGVASPAGVLATGLYTDIIDSAREKLDGYEVIVYTISTRSGKHSFFWSNCEHYELPEPCGVGHYEKVGFDLYFLGGINSLNGKKHYWEYLSEDLIERVRKREGIIVRMSGKEYRLPWKHSATLSVRGGIARDLSCLIQFKCNQPDGLYDFVWSEQESKWEFSKARPDKVRADSNGGINEMLQHSATLSEFLGNVQLSRIGGLSPMNVVVVPLSLNKKEKIHQALQIEELKVRITGGYKQLDSYRRIVLEDVGGQLISSFQVCPNRPNIIVSCGRVIVFKRHEKLLYLEIDGKYYTTSNCMGSGKVKIIRLRVVLEDSINLNGPIYRVYEVNPMLFKMTTEEWAVISSNMSLCTDLVKNISGGVG